MLLSRKWSISDQHWELKKSDVKLDVRLGKATPDYGRDVAINVYFDDLHNQFLSFDLPSWTRPSIHFNNNSRVSDCASYNTSVLMPSWT